MRVAWLSIKTKNMEKISGVIVVWNWETFVGYARNFVELRWAYNETEDDMLQNTEVTWHNNMEVAASAEEIEGMELTETNLRALLTYNLLEIGNWKWRNNQQVQTAIMEFCDGFDAEI